MEKITLETITSKNNQLIKDTKKLLTSSKARHENKSFVLEGARLCFDVLNSVFGVGLFLITPQAYNKYTEKADKIIAVADNAYFISDEVAEKLGETSTSQGVFCVCKMQDIKKPLGEKVIILDNVQDPSNIGSIIRSGEALGISAVVAYNCCDIFNSKAVRASMGSVLRMNVLTTDNLIEFIKNIQDKGYKVYSTVPNKNALSITKADFSSKSACVIGNEANGVEQQVIAASNDSITIPMLGRAESLNAAVAASITMWEMLR